MVMIDCYLASSGKFIMHIQTILRTTSSTKISKNYTNMWEGGDNLDNDIWLEKYEYERGKNFVVATMSLYPFFKIYNDVYVVKYSIL